MYEQMMFKQGSLILFIKEFWIFDTLSTHSYVLEAGTIGFVINATRNFNLVDVVVLANGHVHRSHIHVDRVRDNMMVINDC